MNKLATLLIIAAALLTLYATASFLTGFDTDFQNSALLAALCLVCVVLLNRAQYLRSLRALTRQSVWARRDREAGRDV